MHGEERERERGGGRERAFCSAIMFVAGANDEDNHLARSPPPSLHPLTVAALPRLSF